MELLLLNQTSHLIKYDLHKFDSGSIQPVISSDADKIANAARDNVFKTKA